MTAYQRGDLDGVIAALDEARAIESDHGDAPASNALRSEMLTEGVHCGCGQVTGVRCEWSGPESETVVVEHMPRSLRGSHEAAGNSGSWPSNGADRIRMERSCADMIVESEGGWAEIVG